jgi:hypothetical protein
MRNTEGQWLRSCRDVGTTMIDVVIGVSPIKIISAIDTVPERDLR